MKNIKQYIKTILFILVINLFLFLILEGFCSTLIIASGDLFKPICLEPNRAHTKYDELLGWVSIPNIEIKDGSKIILKTNSQGFRNDQDFNVNIPKGKVRIICCGDSFTLGFGADNEHTWCEQLTSFNKHLETINIGQDGYGVDQAYLWYMRDGRKFKHDIHIFAFITNDFYRMGTDKFCQWCKPILKLANGNLIVKNVPVPRYSYLFPALREYVERIGEFKLYQFLEKFFHKICLFLNIKVNLGEHEIQTIALKIFEDLQQINKEKDSTLVLVHLPEYKDFITDESDVWRKWLEIETTKRDIIYIDLIDEFKKLPSYEINSLFRIKADGHYSERGNKLVARMLYKKLFSIDGKLSKLLK